MSYETLRDPASHEDQAFSSAKVVTKFCSMGLVASQKWSASYLTILDGVVKLYDSEASSISDPQNCVLRISLDKHHRASPIVKKNYSKDDSKIIEFHSFYIEIDNGAFFPTRLLKIGCLEREQAEALVRAINLNIRGY